MESERQPLVILRPPDFVFKYRKRNRVAPSTEIIKHGDSVFKFIGVKYPAIYNKYPDSWFTEFNIQREWFKYPVAFTDGKLIVFTEYPPLTEEESKMGGQLTCFESCPYPFKGHPFPEALYAVNVAKRFTRTIVELAATKDIIPFALTYLFLSRKKKIRLLERGLSSFVQVCRQSMDTYILGRDFMTKYGREIMDFVSNFLDRLGVEKELSASFAECFASLIDWDNAYWMRIGDAFASTTKEKMLADPRGELLKMAKLLQERNPQDPATAGRLYKTVKLISLLLFIPKYRRIFKECLASSEFSNFQFDEADDYHAQLYGDYNYGGKTIQERLTAYQEYHKQHPPEPPRIRMEI